MSKQVNEPVTKPGKHGTLYLYQIAYCDVMHRAQEHAL